MPNETPNVSPEVLKAFSDHDRQAAFNNFKAACYLGIALMPVGVSLDYFIYRTEVVFFLKLRVLCSLLIAGFLGVVLLTQFGRKYYRFFGMMLAMLPTFFISWMIYRTDGATSSYYAGINLVLLVVGFVLNWTFAESFSAVALV